MRWRCLFLFALLWPELALDPFNADLPAGLPHVLGTDSLGRDGLLRLLHSGARSFGFASAVALASLALGLWLALGEDRFRDGRSALRSLPSLLLLIPLAGAFGGFGWTSLALCLAALQSLQLEPVLRARLDPFRRGPAWAMNDVLGASAVHRVKAWAPWALQQATTLFPTAWLASLWGEATLRLLGLGPGPHHDSLGLVLNEELPRLSTDGTALGIASLVLVLALAWSSTRTLKEPT
jgi:peptide/nickel transport system permease protein